MGTRNGCVYACVSPQNMESLQQLLLRRVKMLEFALKQVSGRLSLLPDDVDVVEHECACLCSCGASLTAWCSSLRKQERGGVKPVGAGPGQRDSLP